MKISRHLFRAESQSLGSRAFISILRCLLMSFLVLASLACSSPLRKFPIQLTRASQIDYYKQYYEFDEGVSDSVSERTIIQIVGGESWDFFSRKSYGLDIREFKEKIKNRKIYIEGALINTLYLHPADHDSFFIDALGRYALIYIVHDKKEIPFTADFFVKNSGHSISTDLRKRQMLTVEFSQLLLRHFQLDKAIKAHEFTNASLELDIKMEQVDKKKKAEVFRISYIDENHKPVQHDMFFKSDSSRIKIGHLEFENLPHNANKLLDLRGRSLIRKDYKK